MANPRNSFSDFGQFSSGGPAAPPGAFGTRVAPVANVVAPTPVTPWDRNQAVIRAAPLQPQAGGAAWQNAIDMMGGGVSKGTQNYIRDRAAALGVNLGAGGADWTTNNALIGEVGTSEDRVKAGLAAYNALLSGTQNLVNDPTATLLANNNTEMQARLANNEIQQWNNTNAAAPDPAAAAQYQKQLFDEQIKMLSQAYRSPAGGTGAYGRPGVTSGTPTWASVASPPNLAAPGFARPAAQPGLLNTATFTNGIYMGGGGGGDTRTFAPQQPVLQPNQINYQPNTPGSNAGIYTGPVAGYDAQAPNPLEDFFGDPGYNPLDYNQDYADWLNY